MYWYPDTQMGERIKDNERMLSLGKRLLKDSVRARVMKVGSVGTIREEGKSCLGYIKTELVMKYIFPGILRD